MELVTESAKGTERVATALLPHLAVPDIVTLEGDLGSGKTVFARALIRAALGKNEEVPSPTFTLVQTYPFGGDEIWHVDLYRLSLPVEVIELGLEEAFADAISLVEWPDRLGGLLPADRLQIAFSYGAAPDTRHIHLTGHGCWHDRLDQLGAALRRADAT